MDFLGGCGIAHRIVAISPAVLGGIGTFHASKYRVGSVGPPSSRSLCGTAGVPALALAGSACSPLLHLPISRRCIEPTRLVHLGMGVGQRVLLLVRSLRGRSVLPDHRNQPRCSGLVRSDRSPVVHSTDVV